MAPSWTLRRCLAFLALLGLSGCPGEVGDPPLPFCGGGEPSPFPGLSSPQPAVVRVGQKVRLEITPLASINCDGSSNPPPTSVTADVEGPDGQLIASQIALGASGNPAILEFTPERPGPHHLLVAFSPKGGLHQFDLHAAADRSSEAPSQTLARPCHSLERTLQGAWVCEPEILRGDTSLGMFPDSRMAVAGDVIWVVLNSRVERYVDTGTALILTGSTPHARGAVEFLRASPDDLAVLHGASLARYAFEDGVVKFTGAVPWSRPTLPIAPTSPYGILLRTGDRLALGIRSFSGSSTVVQLCPYRLLSGTFQRTQEVCQVLSGAVVGVEPTALWTHDLSGSVSGVPSAGLLRRWEWSGGQLVEQGSLLPGNNAIIHERPLMGSASAPLVSTRVLTSSMPPVIAVVTWSTQRRAMLLEYLDPEMIDVYASPALYWTLKSAATGRTTSVRIRPPPP